jgi:hypothetical protein
MAVVAAPAGATYRNLGYLSTNRPEISWTGNTGVTDPVDCTQVRTEPLCDHTWIHVNAAGRNVEVVVTPEVESDQLALWVYETKGPLHQRIASSSTFGSTERVVLAHPKPGVYDFAVQSVLAPGGGGYSATVRVLPEGSAVDNDPPLCNEDTLAKVQAIAVKGIPALPGTPFVADDGRNVFLDVFVVLDGVTASDAAAAVAKVARPYAPIGITVRGIGYVPMSFTSNEAGDIIKQARHALGGRRPAGSDLVLVITTRDITSLGIEAVAGQADCIGGVSDPTRAFMVAEAAGQGAELVPDFAAKTTAHEMGHLMGGQHHFANCVEALSVDNLFAFTPCTLMFNEVSLLSMQFSTINGDIVRGAALKYAQP